MRLAFPQYNDRAVIGGNNPPSPIEYARHAMADLSRFLSDAPVIGTVEEAQEGALFVERSRKTIQDLEDARKKEVAPLNEQVRVINEQYRTIRDPLDKVLTELRHRLTDYTAREEAKRIREAEEARRAADLAEMEARLAEQREREAKQNATFGEVTDVAAAVIEADQKFSTFKKADRAAQIAERDTTVRLPSQLGGKAISMRAKETLVLNDAHAALTAIGVNQKITDAILSAARDYRKVHDKLPPGVSAELTREI